MAEDGGDEGCRRGFSMRPGDRDGIFHPHQFGQHLGPLNNGDEKLPGLLYLGIVGPYRRRDDDDIGVDNVFLPMALKNDGSEGFEPFGYIGLANVGTGHFKTEVDQHLGDAAHSNAAYAHKMDAFDLMKDHVLFLR